jgi:hypothetical protein
MAPDPTEEIRAIKRELAAIFDYDIHRIFADLQRQQQESGREYITLPPRPPRQQPTTSNMLPTGNPATTSDSQQTNPS